MANNRPVSSPTIVCSVGYVLHSVGVQVWSECKRLTFIELSVAGGYGGDVATPDSSSG